MIKYNPKIKTGIIIIFFFTSFFFYFNQGQLVGVIGTVGSGKSSLLAAITAEMTKEAGHICVTDLTGGFGLVSQESWIQHATVRENILFGNTFNFRFYNQVVQACALEEDFKVNLILYCCIIMKSLGVKNKFNMTRQFGRNKKSKMIFSSRNRGKLVLSAATCNSYLNQFVFEILLTWV